MVDVAAGMDLREAQHLSMSLPPYVVIAPTQPAAAAAGSGPADAGDAAGEQGAMATPAPRARTVTFVDEGPQGPADRVRLAPTELFRQMQDTLKT